ncbi:Glutamate decarboxylase 1 [Hordeum vulgare]|nr:Glutamate decarboxylase 1 [Hordeum vulgare]
MREVMEGEALGERKKAEAFSCMDGEKEKATKALAKSAREILPDVKHTLRYKALMQCWLLDDKGGNMTRKSSCHTNLEKEEYLSVVSDTIGC